MPPFSILKKEAVDSFETLLENSVGKLFRKASRVYRLIKKNSYSVTKAKESVITVTDTAGVTYTRSGIDVLKLALEAVCSLQFRISL